MLWSAVAPAVSAVEASRYYPRIGEEVMYQNPNDDQTPPRLARVTSVDADKGWCWIEFLEFFPSAHNRQEYCPFEHLSPRKPGYTVQKGLAYAPVSKVPTVTQRMLW